MTAPAAQLRGVSKSFGRGATLVRALQDVDLEIHAGELTLIEGPSGSGKTTLLHILGLLQPPDEGQIFLGGRRMDGLPEARLPDERAAGVVLIFQGYNLLEALTARDNVAVAGLLTRAARRIIQEPPTQRAGLSQAGFVARGGGVPLARLGLADRANHLPAELSGGEKQRVAIARALACPGRLVLADEPTANLDWENARDVVQRLAELAHTEGRAVVMVAHDSRLEPFADRIVGLLNGQISSDRRCGDVSMNHVNGSTDATESPQGEGAQGGSREARADTTNACSEEPRAPALDGARRGPGSARAASDPPTGPRAGDRRRPHGGLVLWPCLIVLLLLAGVLADRYLLGGGPAAAGPDQAPAADGPATPYVAAAPAVVEPGTLLVALQSERRGRIKAILKRAGDRIRRGEPLVLLDGATPKALVDIRRADLKLAEADLAQLEAWDRPEKRARAKAGVDRGQARLDRAERELARIQKLFERDAAPESELDEAIEEKRLAAAALEEARQTWSISKAGPIAEEVSVAEARVEQARAALRQAETELALRTIVSPLDGHVIYRHLEPGEVVDPESPAPILSLGNLDEIRLRAEVDEADIQLVHVGQRIEATAAAYAARTFTGRVVHLEPLMGRKTIRTERTTEQQDTKVREVLIELAPDTPALPIDLQMTVRFLASSAPATTPAEKADARP